MPLPSAVARANRYLVNPLVRRLAGRVPPVVAVEHAGRVSGRRFRTPVFGFHDRDTGAIEVALTYGPDVDWIKNLRAAGGGRVVARGGAYEVGSPVIETGLDAARALPPPLKPILRLMRVSDVARLPIRSPRPARFDDPARG